MLVDLHCHTIFSHDTWSTFRMISWFCRKKGIECLAVTDHNEIEGALRLKEIGDIKVIVGQEVSTSEGEIIGLFLNERIPKSLSPEKTVEAIREQGGLVYLPHPFSGSSRKKKWREGRLHEIAELIDIVEVYNARNLSEEYNWKAKKFAEKYDLLIGAGSDAHTPWEIGNTLVEMDEFKTPKEFLQNLKQARLIGRRSSKIIRAIFNCYTRKLLRKLLNF